MFQLAKELNKTDMDFYIAICKDDLEDRGTHWSDTTDFSTHIFYYKSSIARHKWVKDTLNKVNPDVVISGFSSGDIIKDLVHFKPVSKYKLGIWSEQMPKGLKDCLFLNFIRRHFYRHLWKQKVDFMLSIGDRALREHKKTLRSNSNCFFYPYYQEVESSATVQEIPETLTFLFSGRLVKRNNIRKMYAAFRRLNKNYPGRFRWIISANGSEQQFLDKKIKQDKALNFITFDREFKTWDERLRPFKNSNVLIVPARHSGWGLVVNEALSLGLPVITTHGVECARYLIEHNINGLFINDTENDIYNSLEHFIKNPSEVQRMSENALQVKQKHSLAKGVKRMSQIMNFVMQKQ